MGRKNEAATLRQERTGATFGPKFDYDPPRKAYEEFKADLGGFWHLEDGC